MNEKDKKEFERYFNEQFEILKQHSGMIFQRIINKRFELEEKK